jgi:hypothetical protein
MMMLLMQGLPVLLPVQYHFLLLMQVLLVATEMPLLLSQPSQ